MTDALTTADRIARRLGLTYGVVVCNAVCGLWIHDRDDDTDTMRRATVLASALRQKGVTSRLPVRDGAGIFVGVPDIDEQTATAPAFEHGQDSPQNTQTDDTHTQTDGK